MSFTTVEWREIKPREPFGFTSYKKRLNVAELPKPGQLYSPTHPQSYLLSEDKMKCFTNSSQIRANFFNIEMRAC